MRYIFMKQRIMLSFATHDLSFASASSAIDRNITVKGNFESKKHLLGNLWINILYGSDNSFLKRVKTLRTLF